jgi:hypothetical protein
MFTGIFTNETKKYVSRYDPDKANPTVFLLGTLDPFVDAYIKDKTSRFESSSAHPDEEAVLKLDFSTRNLLQIKFGLRGIENLLDPETKQVLKVDLEKVSIDGRNYQVVPDKVLALISDPVLIGELADEIRKINTLTQEERKN